MSDLTSRRHYSNGSAEASLLVSIDNVATSFTLSTATGFPAVPFTAILDYLGSAEEVVLVTGMAGATVTTCVRGYDGTSDREHGLGTSFVHGLVAQDLDEANDHTSSTAAHGTTGDVVGTDDAQVVTNKTVSSSTLLATATDPAVRAQAAAAGVAALLAGYDETGAVLLARIGQHGDVTISPDDPAAKQLIVKGAALQTGAMVEVQDNTGAALWVVHAKGRVRQTPTDVSDAAVKYIPPSAAAATYLALRDTGDLNDLFLLTAAGEITSAAKLWLRGIGADDALRFPLDGSKLKVTSAGAVVAGGDVTVQGVLTVDGSEANNVPSTPGVTGRKIQSGSLVAALAALTAGGNVVFDTPFAVGTTPQLFLSAQDVDGTVAVAASFDGLTRLGFNYRLTQISGGAVSRSLTLNWLAIGV